MQTSTIDICNTADGVEDLIIFESTDPITNRSNDMIFEYADDSSNGNNHKESLMEFVDVNFSMESQNATNTNARSLDSSVAHSNSGRFHITITNNGTKNSASNGHQNESKSTDSSINVFVDVSDIHEHDYRNPVQCFHFVVELLTKAYKRGTINNILLNDLTKYYPCINEIVSQPHLLEHLIDISLTGFNNQIYQRFYSTNHLALLRKLFTFYRRTVHEIPRYIATLPLLVQLKFLQTVVESRIVSNIFITDTLFDNVLSMALTEDVSTSG